jgi:DMSO/TMAO reductase YedYZ molybdopterin-dependent catalytic subunit
VRRRITGVTSKPDSPGKPDSRRKPGRSHGTTAPGGSHPARRYTARGVVTGLLAAAAALGVAQFVAGITGPVGSPVVAVGQSVIGLTPRPVTDLVIKIFGPHDKLVLLITIVGLLALFAAAFGIATMHRPAAGFAGLTVFAVIGLFAVATRPNSRPGDVIPTLAGAAAGAYVLSRLARAAGAAGAAALPTGATPPAQARPPAQAAGAAAGGRPGYDRRSFIVTSAVVAAGAAAGGVAGNLLSQRSTVTHARTLVRLPKPVKPLPPLAASTDLRIRGLSPFVTPNGSFYRVDTALFIPQVAPSTWRLRVHGMVSRELDISFGDLIKRPLTEADITLCCVSNPVGGPYISNTRWLGVPLASVLREAGIKPGADQLLTTSTDGYTSGTPVATVMDGRNALLAVAMDGAPLPVAHGFPVRMVVPGLYGYVSATKWLTDINVTTFAAEQGYWVQQGWAQRGPVKTESRIDVPNGTTELKAGRIAVAGVAWAQHRGVAAVEARVDGGPWQEARLGTVPGIDTWRQWVWDWDATAGGHQLQVRATDETGYTQQAVEENPFPDGATGWHTIQVTVSA